MKLENNGQLYSYLIELGSKLIQRGVVDLGDSVRAASELASTFPATEFLGQSRIALRRVQEECAVLSENERSGLVDVLQQLDEAFSRRR